MQVWNTPVDQTTVGGKQYKTVDNSVDMCIAHVQ